MLSGGGAAMPEAVAAMLMERYGLTYNEGYGLTETASFLHGNPLAARQAPVPGHARRKAWIRASSIRPRCRELPVGEVGELVTHAPQVMKGYWRNPEADREAFVEIDGKRFFRTGDLASMDEEGYFFMRDRLKRMINASGYKVWPAEVENAMYEHPGDPRGLRDRACPTRKQGETVKALVVLKPGLRGEVSEQDIIDWARERMAVYKAPRIVRVRGPPAEVRHRQDPLARVAGAAAAQRIRRRQHERMTLRVRFERRGATAVITLDSPAERNALTRRP